MNILNHFGIRTQFIRKDPKSYNRTTKIIKDPEWNEYQVKLYIDGKHQKSADYHTRDRDDAEKTAREMEK
jgi:hypothetical protein